MAQLVRHTQGSMLETSLCSVAKLPTTVITAVLVLKGQPCWAQLFVYSSCFRCLSFLTRLTPKSGWPPSRWDTQGSKFPPVRLPGTSRFSVGQPKTLSPLALWASKFWVQLLVKRCQPKVMISFSSTVGLVSCKPTPFQPFLSHFHLHPPQLCSLTEKAKLSRWGAWRPRTHSMVSLVIIDLDHEYFVT